jgi:hypothetical protein
MVMDLPFLLWLGYQTEWPITASLSSYFAMSIEPLIWAKFRYLNEAIVTDEQLTQAKSLKGATLPDGTVHD